MGLVFAPVSSPFPEGPLKEGSSEHRAHRDQGNPKYIQNLFHKVVSYNKQILMSDVDECEEMETGSKRLNCKTNLSLKNLSCRAKV